MEVTPNVVIVGAGPTARALGRVLVRSGQVCLVDSNRDHCRFAEADGLTAVHGSALEERVLRKAAGHRAGVFIALTPNAEVNALSARLARDVLRIGDIHIVSGSDADGHAKLLQHVGASTLFGGPIGLPAWDYWIEHDLVERTGLTMERLPPAVKLFQDVQTRRPVLPLALRRGADYLPFHGGSTVQREDRIILLHPPESKPHHLDRFDRLVARCPILDVAPSQSVEDFFSMAAAALAEDVGVPASDLVKRFLDRETTDSTVIAPGFAIPHVIVGGSGHFHLLIARCRKGTPFPGRRETVHAVFIIVRSSEERNFHLRSLAAIAQIMQDPDFEARWLQASGPEDLRKMVLGADRRRSPEREDERWSGTD